MLPVVFFNFDRICLYLFLTASSEMSQKDKDDLLNEWQDGKDCDVLFLAVAAETYRRR